MINKIFQFLFASGSLFLSKLSLVIFFIMPLYAFAAGYSVDRLSTTSGASYWGSSILRMDASISGTYLYVTAAKQSGSFSSSGKMYLQVGSPESYGEKRITANISAGVSSVSLNHDLAGYSGYPKYFYIRYESNDGGWAWAGPITVTYTEPSDTTNPTGSISGISSSYTQGNTVSYSVSGYDNKQLQALSFQVTKSGSSTKLVDRSWSASRTSASYSSSFSTSGWLAGTYYYALWVKDAANNAKGYTGSFTLNEPADTTNPTGSISGISSNYTQGNTVSYSVSGYDNKQLQALSFQVTKSGSSTKLVDRSWSASGISASYSSSFSTSGWSAGTYYYALWIKDAANNARGYTGSFTLNEVTSVSSVSPLTVSLNQKTTFTVNGQNLPSTLALFIPECDGMTSLAGGSSTSRQFSCTPSYTAGTKSSLVKNASGGSTLFTFNVSVVDTTPQVSSVLPLSAILNQQTTFTVNGQNLPSTLALFIPECEGMTALAGGSTTSRQFSCTPSYTTGSKASLVKDKSGDTGNELFRFAVDVKAENKYVNVSDWAQEAADYLVSQGIIDDPASHDLRGTSIANRAELATMIYRALGGGKANADSQFHAWAGADLASTFLDVNDASVWYYDEVVYLSHLQFTDGIAVFDRGSGDQMNPLFRPATSISRAWTLKAILESWNLAPLKSFTGISLFSDVPVSHPAAGYIYRAVQEGLVKGDSTSNTYRPDELVNREDVFVILHRLMQQSANLQNKQLNKPTISQGDFSSDPLKDGRIGIRYEQPVCYGVTPPTIAIQKFAENIETQEGVELYTVDLMVNASGGSASCVDSNNVTHTQSLFAAWRADSGTFVDITPAGATLYSQVRWIAPDRYSSGESGDDYQITAYVGDNLGAEVSDNISLVISQPSNSTNIPQVTLDALPAQLTGGSTITLSGTAQDAGDSSRSTFGIREVELEYVIDGGSWEPITRNLSVSTDNRWEYEWFVPDTPGNLTIRAQGRNVEGNVNSGSVTQSAPIIPEMSISGYVLSSSGEPLINAQVTLSGPVESVSLTDNYGSFSFTALTSGSYSLLATKEGLLPNAVEVSLSSSSAKQEIEVILRVLNDTDGDKIPDDTDDDNDGIPDDTELQDGTNPLIKTAHAPTVAPNGGTFDNPVSLVVGSYEGENAVVHYTLDGSTPTAQSPVAPPLTISQSATLKLIAIAPGLENSKVVSATFVVNKTPSVASVLTFSASATLGEQTIFAVSGFNLPDTLAFYIPDCANVTKVTKDPKTGTPLPPPTPPLPGMPATMQVYFSCTPTGAAGVRNGGLVKDKSGGTVLKTFSVEFKAASVPAPVITAISPTSLEQSFTDTTVVLQGSGFLDSATIAVKLPDGNNSVIPAENIQSVTEDEIIFLLRPGAVGTYQFQVKNTPDKVSGWISLDVKAANDAAKIIPIIMQLLIE